MHWIAPSAVVEGEVSLGKHSSVWHQCVLRGDLAPIHIGDRSNVQDGTVIHVDPGFPCHVGANVTIGHRAVVHGCRIEDRAVVGMGAILLTGCHIHEGAVVAAGAVVREGQQVEAGTIVGGVPAKLLGRVDAEAAKRFESGVERYVQAAAQKQRTGSE